ncbi:hypothetical protein [Saccharothrix deserti]|uniref:hypothetical protein n=1 Tax=Saccharothrix deserti TaxID=2593674 RepID=UPI001EE431ED|nr:hypothetical protein [Saccharothrix deserti]
MRVLIVAALLVASAACDGRQTGEPAVTDPIEVELDIFSGMPNPTWVLSDADSAELRRRIDESAATTGSAPSGNLGYRGFLVQLTEGAQPARVRQVVQLPDGSAREAGDRELERWLLDTGRDRLPSDVVAAVEQDLG